MLGCGCLFVLVPATSPPSQLQGYSTTIRFCIVTTIDLYGFLALRLRLSLQNELVHVNLLNPYSSVNLATKDFANFSFRVVTLFQTHFYLAEFMDDRLFACAHLQLYCSTQSQHINSFARLIDLPNLTPLVSLSAFSTWVMATQWLCLPQLWLS